MAGKARYVVVSVLILAVLSGMMLSHTLNWLFVRQGWDDPFIAGVRELPMTTVLAYVLAAAAVAFCLLHKPTWAFSLEVADELSKVSWPTRDETQNATAVVLFTVVLCSAYLGAFDAVWLWMTDLLLGVPPTPAG